MIVLGLLLMAAAVFAREIGIDNNTAWGSKRVILFAIGIVLFLTGSLYPYLEKQAIPAVEKSAAFGLLNEYRFLLPVFGVVLLVYIWFATTGLWTRLPERREYYSLLAQSFQKQKLHLEVRPSEKLLALPNPYDPSQRIGVGEPLDFSLYNDRFYLYWGPVPALVLAAFGLAGLNNYHDLYLVFGFSYGLFLLLTSLVIFIREHYFSGLPKWNLVMSVLLLGLSGPLAWMVGTGEIYEAAIVVGQFFLIAGFLTALSALDRVPVSDIR